MVLASYVGFSKSAQRQLADCKHKLKGHQGDPFDEVALFTTETNDLQYATHMEMYDTL